MNIKTQDLQKEIITASMGEYDDLLPNKETNDSIQWTGKENLKERLKYYLDDYKVIPKTREQRLLLGFMEGKLDDRFQWNEECTKLFAKHLNEITFYLSQYIIQRIIDECIYDATFDTPRYEKVPFVFCFKQCLFNLLCLIGFEKELMEHLGNGDKLVPYSKFKQYFTNSLNKNVYQEGKGYCICVGDNLCRYYFNDGKDDNENSYRCYVQEIHLGSKQQNTQTSDINQMIDDLPF